MKIRFPSYYKDFKCLADRCRHSCCVGWEIDVDAQTMARYGRLEGELGEEIRAHILGDPPAIELSEDERCPFLDGCGLCRIISTLGEGAVSMICLEHPRFYHSLGGRIEGGIGAVCEEACRIILSSDAYADFIEDEREIDTLDEGEFNATSHRDHLFSLLSGKDYTDALAEILHKYSLTDPVDRAGEWNEMLSQLEYLDESRVGLLKVGRKSEGDEIQGRLARFFAYLIFRHVSPAESYDNLRARVGFCILLSRVFENLIAGGGLDFEEICDIARIISEEIEYSEDNTASLIFEIESEI